MGFLDLLGYMGVLHEDLVEVVFLQHEKFREPFGHHRGVAGLVGDEGHLAEIFVGAQLRHLHTAVPLAHPNRDHARGDEVKGVAGISLPNKLITLEDPDGPQGRHELVHFLGGHRVHEIGLLEHPAKVLEYGGSGLQAQTFIRKMKWFSADTISKASGSI